jgi:four helix bundle protein
MQNYKNNIRDRVFKFGVRVIKMTNALPKTPSGYAIANQVVRSGTSIGANIEEAQSAVSRKDFIHSINIALKEARETYYWIKILTCSEILNQKQIKELLEENEEIIKILVTIIKRSKENS